MRRLLTITVILAAAATACSADQVNRSLAPNGQGSASVQAVLDWSAISLRITAAPPLDPPRESRTLAMVHLAIYDAVEAITHDYRPYLAEANAPSGASAPAAVASAAHDVLVALYSQQRAGLDASYTSSLAAIGDGAGKQEGIVVGRRAAAAVLAARSHDHASDLIRDNGSTVVGKWHPTPPAFKPALDPGWGRVTPFALARGAQFRPGLPPALISAAYARDFNEIKLIGSASSTARTPAQTEVARFWTVTAPQEWNQLARGLVLSKHLALSQSARLFAVLNVAEADAAIASWDTKFTYKQWRPVTGIRDALADGNPATAPDPAWTPLIPTPRFPDYVCGHSTLGGAAAAVLRSFFGDQPGTLTMTSSAVPGAVHRFSSFSAIEDEVTNARVWGGIHWRTSCVVGRTVGENVGRWVTSHIGAPAK